MTTQMKSCFLKMLTDNLNTLYLNFFHVHTNHINRVNECMLPKYPVEQKISLG